jgi:Fe-S cluster assembly ATPase SufC
MSLKNLLKSAIVALSLTLAIPSIATAAVSDSTADVAALNTIVTRVNEIQNMDKSNLSATEKKELKKELKQMKHQADGLGRGVYLSVGAIIIIILLLILIL